MIRLLVDNARAALRADAPAGPALLLLFALVLPGGAAAQTGASSAAPAGGLRIHVRGTAEIQAVASTEGGKLTINGVLVDDAGVPIPASPIVVQAFAPDRPGTAIRVGPLSACEGSSGRGVPRSGPDEAVVETDDRGGFCAVGKASAPRLTLKLRFRGSRIYDAAEREVSVDPDQEHRLHTLLRFEPPPETIDLDRESVTVTASLRVDRTDAMRQAAGVAGSAQRANLPLVLEDERAAHVAEAVTGGDGRARFEVKTAALDGPGRGELFARFGGSAVLARAVASQRIVRRAEAHVTLTRPVEGDADDGVPIDVDVTTSRGPVRGGVVEVRRVSATTGDAVGAGAVDDKGHAHIVAAFPAGGASKATLALRYVPAAEWYRAGPELRVEIKLAGPGVLRELLLAGVVIAAAAWVVGGWRRAPRAKVLPGVEGATAPPSGRAGVHVLGSPADLTGWRGTVTDAHEGTPIAGARISIIAPAFSGDGVVARAVTDERGAFVLEGQHRGDARLLVESGAHSSHEQGLPPPSVLGVALVTRRRALLDRLVRWARQRGAPFDGAPEPTPGHVRRVAARAGAAEIEAWAGRIENAAYGPEAPGHAVEREVRAAEPGRAAVRP
jgi:hypothetical protein